MANELTTQNPFGASERSQVTTPVSSASQAESQRAVAEVQAALFIARANPRDEIRAMDRILNSCCRPTLAATATYLYSRGGTEIAGPSIRLAETVAQQWGNMQYGIRELSNSGGKSEVQAFAWDVETNTRREITFSVPHIRHTKKGSYKLEDPRDIYELVANQGARRLRACILSVIPGDVIEAAVNQCAITLKNNVDVTPEGIKNLIEAFNKFGVAKEQIEKFCQCRSDAIKPAQVIRLRQIYRSLLDGMSNPSDWFEPLAEAESAEKKTTASSLKEKIKTRKQKQAEAEKAKPEPQQMIENNPTPPADFIDIEPQAEMLPEPEVEREIETNEDGSINWDSV